MKTKLITLLMLSVVCVVSEAQTVLDNFETGVTFTTNLRNHMPNDAIVSVDENPKRDAINNSDAVILFSRKTTANFWTGFFGDLTEAAKLKTREHSILQIKYYRTSIKSTLRIKINGDNVVGEFEPINAPVKINEWEILEFDYAAKGYSEIANLDIRPDWCAENEVEVNRKSYVDDLTLSGTPKQFDGKIATFEQGLDGFFGVQNANVTLETVANDTPNDINKSATCLKVTRSASAANWEGAMKNGFTFNIGTAEGEFRYLNFDIKKPIISSIGIVIKNDPITPDQGSYIDNSKINEWEHFAIDLNQYPGTKNTIFIQPELTGGAVVLYLDNIFLSKSIDTGIIPNTTTSNFRILSYSRDRIVVSSPESGSFKLYNTLGMLVDEQKITSERTELTPHSSGTFILQWQNENNSNTTKVIVE